MSVLHVLTTDESRSPQSAADLSFVGGRPRLPAGSGLPRCTLCNQTLTFFLQLAFPPGNVWQGRTLAVFACTACCDEDYCIPEMVKGPLAGADIPSGFLDSYQANFRILIFDTAAAVIHDGYRPSIVFKPLRPRRPDECSAASQIQIGGAPKWMHGDESPRSYNGTVPMQFLCQIQHGFHFEIHPEAPRQVVLGLDRTPEVLNLARYELFIGSELSLFGTGDGAEPKVYIFPGAH